MPQKSNYTARAIIIYEVAILSRGTTPIDNFYRSFIFQQSLVFRGEMAKWFEASLNRQAVLGLYIGLFAIIGEGLRVG
jgi:hypothetical protein